MLTTDPDPGRAWTAFYRNSLRRLTAEHPGQGTIGELAPIYRLARSLVRGQQVLDVGSCFGFLPILLAQDGHTVIASDLSCGSMRLLSTVDTRIRCLCCFAEALPVGDRSVDTVLALHLLEHLDAAAGAQALAEAVRVARLRVVLAVPYEDRPAAVYGHVRTLDHATLAAMGAGTGLRHQVFDRYGGWLVIDR